jgi:chromosome segregation ATPase
MSVNYNDWDIIDNHDNVIMVINKLNVKITELSKTYEELNKRYLELKTKLETLNMNYNEINKSYLKLNTTFKTQYHRSVITGFMFPNIFNSSNNLHQ